MKPCQHAANGCNYPEGECSGACLPDMPESNAQRAEKAMQRLTSHINRAAGQHMRAIRKDLKAGEGAR